LSTKEKIKKILEKSFSPIFFEVIDDSAKHKGHLGSQSGGGHYQVTLVSEKFLDESLINQHRMVNDALGGLIGNEIHALGLKTYSPNDWKKN